MAKQMELTSHVIVSQGLPIGFEKYRMQAWVENVNDFLRADGSEVSLFTCGNSKESFGSRGVNFLVSKRLKMLNDPFSPDIPFRILLGKKPSIAIIHGFQHLLTLTSLAICSMRRIPVLIIVHGLYPNTSKILALRDALLKLLLHVFRKNYLMIAVTHYDRQLLLEQWQLPSDRIRVARGFLYVNQKELQEIERMRTNVKRSNGEAPSRVTFLFMGRLDHDQKRVDHLIRLFHSFLIKSKAQNAELVIGGTGPLKTFLQGVVEKLKLQENVRIIGAVTEKEKWQNYLDSTALVLTSRFEGMPRVIFEAFAAGKTVVVPNVCGLKEVVRNGVNGYLYDSDEEFLDVLSSIARGDPRIFTMQETALKMTNQEFSIESGKQVMISIIKNARNLNVHTTTQEYSKA